MAKTFDEVVYSLCKNYTDQSQLGFKSVKQVANGFEIEYVNGTKATYTVQNMHQHTNMAVLNVLNKDADGDLTFNGKKITNLTADQEQLLMKFSLSDDNKLLFDGKEITPEFLDTTGDGTKFLANDGTYKKVAGGSGGASTADAVEYINTTLNSSNVEEALNKIVSKLYYIAPQITSFSMTPSTTVYEIGQTVNSLVFNWATNKDITTQTLTGVTLADATVRTATYNTPISSNKTFTLTVGDGEKTVSKSLTVAFRHKFYWGNATLPDTFDSAFILGLSKSQFATGKAGTYAMNLGTGEYGFLAYPASFGTIATVNIGGFDTDVVDCGSVDFTNASGNTTAFKIYRTGRSGLGSISPVIK